MNNYQLLELKDDYKNLLNKNRDITKIFSSLLVLLGGIVTAVAGLFTVYCICSDKKGTVDWVLFAINVLFILGNFIIDFMGSTYGILKENKSNNTSIKNEKPNCQQECCHYKNCTVEAHRDENNDLKEADFYRTRIKDEDKIIKIKKELLRISFITHGVMIFIVAITIAVLKVNI